MSKSKVANVITSTISNGNNMVNVEINVFASELALAFVSHSLCMRSLGLFFPPRYPLTHFLEHRLFA